MRPTPVRCGPTGNGSRELGSAQCCLTTWSGRTRPCTTAGNGAYDVHTTFHGAHGDVRLPGPPSPSLVAGDGHHHPGRSGRPRWWPSRPPRWTCSTGGHFRLGVATGWEPGGVRGARAGFRTGAGRIEEQVTLMRPSLDRGVRDLRGASSTGSPAPAWPPLPCSDPSGLVRRPVRAGPTAGPAASPTDGSRRSAPGPQLDRPRTSCTPPPSKRPGTRPSSAMEGRISWRR